MAETPETGSNASPSGPAVPQWLSWGLMLLVGAIIWLWGEVAGNRPPDIPVWGWRLLAIFIPTILGLMLRPLPGGAIVLMALLATLIFGALPPAPASITTASGKANWTYQQALGGYMNKSVWLVLAAYFLSRAIIKTGLARRIALLFVRRMGKSTLGLSYALIGTDTVLAAMIPSNAARVGGVLLPIARSLSELYKSFPGKSAALLGSFLMLSLYQCDVINCAMFYTGQASNPLAAETAKGVTTQAVEKKIEEEKANGTLTPQREQELKSQIVDLTYGKWLLYASAPAITCLLIVPWLIYRLNPPELKHTPEAVEMARDELHKMGPPSKEEWVMILVFLSVCLCWILLSSKFITLVALSGAVTLLLTRVLTWEDVVSERRAWDVFIWYGGLVQLGSLLNKANATNVFASTLAESLKFIAPALLFLIILLIYFYAHYGFASITAHVLSMYPAFVGTLLALGAPAWLVAVSFAYAANLCAGLTHYGTTPGPIIFSTHYVSQGTWWRNGFILSVVNIGIFLVVGLPWWKFWGLW